MPNDIIRIGEFILLVDEVFNDLSSVSQLKDNSVTQAKPTQLNHHQSDDISDPLVQI